ncbi:MAG: type III pantothenate kinase [Candidatus Omnitrophota bacterium]
MLLAVDVGNTNIVLGIYRGNRLVKAWRVPAQAKHTVDIARNLRGKNIDAAIICSVVPGITSVLKNSVKRFLGLRPVIVGKDIVAPIRNLYDKPKEVGQDRLVNALAVKIKYGAPAIIVDYGTAITFDLVSARGEYLGGLIVPGIGIALEALFNKAALLPKIKLTKPKALLGKDTVNSMRSGILHGYGALTDGLVNKLRKKYLKKSKVIATGGYAKLISRYCQSIDLVDNNLTLEGLRHIYPASSPAKRDGRDSAPHTGKLRIKVGLHKKF